MASRKKIPGVDAKLLIKDAAKLLPEPSRRFFLCGAGSLGALAVLSGCDIIDGDTSEHALRVVSRFNDRVQAWLFNPNALAPEYPESAITRPSSRSNQRPRSVRHAERLAEERRVHHKDPAMRREHAPLPSARKADPRSPSIPLQLTRTGGFDPAGTLASAIGLLTRQSP
jgi:hypothetical protein